MKVVGRGKLTEKQKRIIKDENLYEEFYREEKELKIGNRIYKYMKIIIAFLGIIIILLLLSLLLKFWYKGW